MKDPSLYEALEALIPQDDPDQTHQVYQTLYHKHYGESDDATPTNSSQPQSQSLSYSFADESLYHLASQVIESSGTDRLCRFTDVYKAMYIACHGDLQGAFSAKGGNYQGEAYSKRYENVLWETGEDGAIKTKPEMTGYLLSEARRASARTPAPLDFEDRANIQDFLYADPDVVASEYTSSSSGFSDSSLLYKLTADQGKQLKQRLDTFGEGSVISLPENVRQSIQSAQQSLSDESIEQADLDRLLLSYRLLNGQPVPTKLAESVLRDTVSNDELLGGQEGQRFLISYLRLSRQSDAQSQSMPNKTGIEDADNYALRDAEQVLSIPGFTVLRSDQDQQDTKPRVRVPIAVKGTWYHPEYGEVKFTQKDFDQMLANFQENVTGYEPPLFLGHENPNGNSVGGQAAAGYLERLYQEGDALIGEFEMVDEATYNDVAEGKYRYASAEYAKQAISKKTNERIGSVLMGTALTNRPHLTGMPRIQALSESDPSQGLVDFSLSHRVFDIQQGETMPDEQAQQEQQGQIDNAQLETVKNLTKQLTDLQSANQQKDQKIQELEEQLNKLQSNYKEDLKKRQLSSIQQLNVPQSAKDNLADMVKNDRISSEQFEDFYRTLSETVQTQQLTEQHGATSATQEENQEQGEESNPSSQIDPFFQQVIEQNRNAAQQVAQQAQQ